MSSNFSNPQYQRSALFKKNNTVRTNNNSPSGLSDGINNDSARSNPENNSILKNVQFMAGNIKMGHHVNNIELTEESLRASF